MPKPVQKPHPPILLPLDSQQSFVPMGRMGYRIAIGGGSSHNERGDAVLKGRRQELPPYRQAWTDAGHPGDSRVVIRISTYVAATQAQAKRTLEAAHKGRTERAAAPGRTRPDASARGANLFGTPEEVVERIHEKTSAQTKSCARCSDTRSRAKTYSRVFDSWPTRYSPRSSETDWLRVRRTRPPRGHGGLIVRRVRPGMGALRRETRCGPAVRPRNGFGNRPNVSGRVASEPSLRRRSVRSDHINLLALQACRGFWTYPVP